VVDFVEQLGELDNTIIVVISDNGASAEGGVHGTFNETLFFNNIEETLEDNLERYDIWGAPGTFPHYSWGWTWAGDTPFRRWKRETYRGGVTDPCIVHWPAGITAKGELRDQYAHAIDIVPTLLDALGIEAPTTVRGVPQSPLQGASFAHTLNDAAAESERHSQYFEMFGHRSIYHEGWKAVCPFPGPSFAEAAEKGRYFGGPLTREVLNDLDANGWELYNTTEDPAETNDLAADMPDKTHEMIQRWYTEAGTYGALPLATADMQRMNTERPTIAHPREQFVYYAGGAPVAFAAAPKLFNRPHSITADVVVPDDGAEGVLITQGSRTAGYSLYVKDGHLHYVYNYADLDRFHVTSEKPIPAGEVSLRYEFEPTGEPDFSQGKGSSGRMQLYIDDELVGSVDASHTLPNMIGVLGQSTGYAAYDTVDPAEYLAPFEFTGEIKQVVIDVSGDVIRDSEAELNRLMAQQ
jgi:arylsulfatase